jgi:hypothetical protein
MEDYEKMKCDGSSGIQHQAGEIWWGDSIKDFNGITDFS